MIIEVEIDEIINREDVLFIDVRSPIEYMNDTIPDSINLPLLSNNEREEIGYVYKNISKEEAKELGLKYASEKLLEFYNKTKEIISSNKSVAFFCYRGGMRSNSIANVISSMGLSVYLIKGGYKSYRNYVINSLSEYNEKNKYIVLHGLTGVGKTKILNLLYEKKQSVINLEKLAANSGSVFGDIAFNMPSRSQKSFESHLLKELKSINNDYIFIESESKRIGNVIIPDFIFSKLNASYHVLIETNIKNRVCNILDDYINENICNVDEMLIKSLNNLRKKLGNEKVDLLIEMIKSRKYSDVIEILMVDYYDPLYDYSIKKIKKYDKIVTYTNIKEAVDALVEVKKRFDRKGD